MNRLKELRKEKKLSQREIASILEVSEKTLSRWENGETQIKPDKAQALADHFSVSVGYLLGYTSDNLRYDDEKIVTQHDGRLWAYSEKRDKERDLQTFVKCLKELQIVISDDQVKAVFNLIQSMNLNNEGNYWGDFISYDLTMSHNVDKVYNDMAKNGYTLLVEDTSKGTRELRLFDALSELIDTDDKDID